MSDGRRTENHLSLDYNLLKKEAIISTCPHSSAVVHVRTTTNSPMFVDLGCLNMTVLQPASLLL